jgi:hypothetical protein
MKLEATVTNAQVLDNMMKRLGNRQAAPLRAQLVWELNRKIDELETAPTLPWFLEKEFTFDTVPQQASYDLPGDFLREYEEGCLTFSYQGALLHKCTKSAKEDLDYTSEYPTVTYALYGDKLIISPMPDEVYNCSLEYYGGSAEISDGAAPVTNAWLLNAYGWASFAALEVVASFHIQDQDMALRFAAEARRAQDAVWRMHEARQHTNRDYKIED